MKGHGQPSGGDATRQPVTVTVLNETDLDLDVERWSNLVAAALDEEGVHGPAESDVIFVSIATISELNEEHMGVSGPTDVLSFPIDDAAPLNDSASLDDAAFPDGKAGPRLVGDIVLCPEIAANNAVGHAGTLDDEIALLLVHSVLHLLGHDHAEPEERAVMWQAEQRLISTLWGEVAETAWSES